MRTYYIPVTAIPESAVTAKLVCDFAHFVLIWVGMGRELVGDLVASGPGGGWTCGERGRKGGVVYIYK